MDIGMTEPKRQKVFRTGTMTYAASKWGFKTKGTTTFLHLELIDRDFWMNANEILRMEISDE